MTTGFSKEYLQAVRAASDEAFEAFHRLRPDIPENLHPYIKVWGEPEVTRIAEERMVWVNQYMRENHPELFD